MNSDIDRSKRGGVVAGLFTDRPQGARALADLKAAGFTRVEISETEVSGKDARAGSDALPPAEARSGGMHTDTLDGALTDDARATGSFFREHDASASSFARELVRLGFSERDAHDLVDGVVNGAALVTADESSNPGGGVAILKRYEADIRYAADARSAAPAAGVAGVAALADEAQLGAGRTSETSDESELQLRSERLVLDKQRVRHGEVRVRKETITEIKSIDVPVSHEELVIERHAVTGEPSSATPLAEETIRIPLSQEQVNVSKETVVREEVEIGKRRVAGVQHIDEAVRHEELHVNDAANPNPGLGRE